MENMYNLKAILEILPVQSKHITVDVPRRGRGEEKVAAEKLTHLTQWEAVEAVETVLGGLLLAEPDEHVALLFSQGASHTHDLTELGEVVADFLFRDLAVLVEET